MPSLILSSRNTIDSQQLREAAQQRGWETLRLDGWQIPDWFEPPNDEVAMFYTAPHAFDIAEQLDRGLLGCSPDWTIRLPQRFLAREIRQTTLEDALTIDEPAFVKHSVSKAFPAAVYSADELREAAAKVVTESLVHVGEPVEFDIEFRCFVADGEIVTSSVYRRFGEVLEEADQDIGVTESEQCEALEFAQQVLADPEVSYPDAFVLDVGVIKDRGWAVVEPNECWASGIYACDPSAVLDVLNRACVSIDTIDTRWDFRSHYYTACP